MRTNPTNVHFCAWTLLAVFSACAWCAPNDEEPDGDAIVARVIESYSGFGNFQADVALRQEKGKAANRELQANLKVLETEDGAKRRKIRVEKPRTLKGAVLLIIEYKDAPSERWVYMPQLRLTRRLADVKAAGPLSEHQDALSGFNAKTLLQQRFTLLRKEDLDGVSCYVVRGEPKESDSELPPSLTWVDTEKHLVRKMQSLGEDGKPIRTLRFLDYKEFPPGHWRAQNITIDSSIDAQSASVVFSNVSFQNKFSKRDFEKRSLEFSR